ncbi:MAG: hypothetical protein JO336_21940 [Acidobacteriia bacterium]|nr:hypothetical protein [Terriglobia bacterium]
MQTPAASSGAWLDTRRSTWSPHRLSPVLEEPPNWLVLEVGIDSQWGIDAA